MISNNFKNRKKDAKETHTQMITGARNALIIIINVLELLILIT